MFLLLFASLFFSDPKAFFERVDKDYTEAIEGIDNLIFKFNKQLKTDLKRLS